MPGPPRPRWKPPKPRLMTRIKFFMRDGLMAGFAMTGHSGAGPAGGDIVCAALSSAAYMAANTVTDVCGCRAQTEVREGRMVLRVAQADRNRCQPVLTGFFRHLRALQAQYPRQINVTIWRCKRHAENKHPAVRP